MAHRGRLALNRAGSCALLAMGLAVTSTGSPALSGTYACVGLGASSMQGEVNAMLLAGATPVFADGSTSLEWPDLKGTVHTFNPAQFHELVVAIANFVNQCFQYSVGITTTAPPASVTIA